MKKYFSGEPGQNSSVPIIALLERERERERDLSNFSQRLQESVAPSRPHSVRGVSVFLCACHYLVSETMIFLLFRHAFYEDSWMLKDMIFY